MRGELTPCKKKIIHVEVHAWPHDSNLTNNTLLDIIQVCLVSPVRQNNPKHCTLLGTLYCPVHPGLGLNNNSV